VTNKEKVRRAIVEGRRKANAEAQALGCLHLVKPEQVPYEVSGAERIVLARATKLKGHQVRQALDELAAEGFIGSVPKLGNERNG
jgi:hypothetical protein